MRPPKAASARPGTLSFFGLGAAPPASLTVQALDLLARADVVYCEGASAALLKSLASYGVKARPVPSAAAVLKELRAGRSVAYAAPGHCMTFGKLARTLHRQARALGLDPAFHYSLSSLDAALALTHEILGISLGSVQVIEPAGDALPEVCEAPAVLRLDGEPKALLAYLRERFPLERPCRFFPKEDGWWASPAEASTLEALGRLPARRLAGGLVFIPA